MVTKTYTLEEVSKHVTEDDCWVVVDGRVLNVTNWLPDHPGGALAILTHAGKDATKEFQMIHPPGVSIEKYAPYTIIGQLDATQAVLNTSAKKASAVAESSSPTDCCAKCIIM